MFVPSVTPRSAFRHATPEVLVHHQDETTMITQTILNLAERCASILPKIVSRREHAENIVATVRSYIANPLLDNGDALEDAADPYLRAPPIGDDGPPWRAVQFLVSAAIDTTRGHHKSAAYCASRCEYYLSKMGV